jgi:hypothetical protein
MKGKFLAVPHVAAPNSSAVSRGRSAVRTSETLARGQRISMIRSPASRQAQIRGQDRWNAASNWAVRQLPRRTQTNCTRLDDCPARWKKSSSLLISEVRLSSAHRQIARSEACARPASRTWRHSTPRPTRNRARATGSWLSTRSFTRPARSSDRLGARRIQLPPGRLRVQEKGNRKGSLRLRRRPPEAARCQPPGFGNRVYTGARRTFLLQS